jgi:hypothetical protein
VIAVLGVAGCGSSKSPSSASGPLSTELSYFPANSVFMLSIQTAPNSQGIEHAQRLLKRFPIAGFGESAVVAKLGQVGIDYQSDVKPLLGNPVVLGFATPAPASNATASLLIVWQTNDASALSALLKKLPGLQSNGTHDGATLYRLGASVTLAVDGATAVFGGSAATVTSALDRHSAGNGVSSSAYAQAFAGLPQNGLVQAFGNLTGVLSQPSAANARKVPWVAALKDYALTFDAGASGLTYSYKLDTTARSLTEAQVPFVGGGIPPQLAGNAPITVGINDPAHIVSFAESAQQASDPSGYAKFERNQAKLRAKTGVDLNSLLSLLTGELIISSDTHTTMGRATLSNPAGAATIIAKLARAPHSVFNTTTRISRLGGGFYRVAEKDGTEITIGVVGKQLLVGKATVPELRAFAAMPATAATGAQGDVAFRVALGALLHLTIHKQIPQLEQTLLSSLGDLTGSVSSSTSGVTGTAAIAVH